MQKLNIQDQSISGHQALGQAGAQPKRGLTSLSILIQGLKKMGETKSSSQDSDS